MAEQKETVVLELNVDSYLEQLRVLNIQIKQAKENQKELSEAAAKGNKEAGIELQRVNVFLKTQEQEYRSVQRALVGFTTAQKNQADTINFVNNSIKTNRALLSQLTEQYNTLKKPPQELISTIKRLSDTLKQQEAAIGDTRRNVGNYKNDILDAIGGLNLFGKNLGGIIDPLSKFGSGLSGVASGATSLTTALATTGLPLLIAGINGLVKAFEGLNSTAGQFKDITNGIAEAAEATVPAFINYGGSLSRLGLALGQAFIAGQAFSEQQRALNKLKREDLITSAEEEKAIQKLLLASRDRNKSEQERVSLLDQAIEKDKEKVQSDIDLLKIERANVDSRIKFLRASGRVFEKELNDRAKLTADITKLEIEQLLFEEKATKRRNALLDEIDREREEAARKERERLEKLRKEQEAYNANIENLREQFLLTERERLAKSFDDKIKTIKGNSQEELDLIFAIEVAKQTALSEFDIKQKAIEDRAREERERKRKEALKAEISLELKQNELMSLLLIDRAELNRQFLQSGIDDFETFYRLKKLQYQQDLEEKKKADAEFIKSEQAKLMAVSSISGSLIDIIGTVAEAAGAGAEFQKALAFVQILVSQAIAIASAVQGATQSGAATGPAAIATTPAFIATLVGAVAATIGGALSLLNSATAPTSPKFADGGGIDIDGKSHAEGGTPIHVNGKLVGEAEKGEKLFILKKTASAQISALSALNQMFGGRSFADAPVSYAASGGAINTNPLTNIEFNDGGYFARAIQRQFDVREMAAALIKAMQSAPNPVVSVKEIDRVSKGLQRGVSVSEAG